MRLVNDVPSLDDAIAAARRTADEATAADLGMATRARIRESLERPSRRRAVVLAAIAATLFGSTAFAYIAFRASARAPVPVAPAANAPVAPAANAPVAPAANAPVAPAPAATAPSAPPAREALAPIAAASPAPLASPPSGPLPSTPPRSIAQTTPAPACSRRAGSPSALTEHVTRSPSRTSRLSASHADAPAPDPELAAYRVAHEMHFHGTDPAAALAAWDAYLAAYPNGQLAVDARYDRALALFKLKRYADARAALAPFAAAAPGSYHQADAARLLRALR